jgi:hypothetical protein
MPSKKLLLVALLVLFAGCSAKQSSSPVVLVASYNSGPGAAILTFRQDSTCEWIAGVGDAPHEGHYQNKDSLVQISGIDLDGVLKSKRFLLTHKNPNNNGLSDPILLQVNNQGSIMDSTFMFRVMVDRRHK